jgi:tetratricopeptide (TPR) repeat protein
LIRKYDEAIVHFKKCLGLTPRNPQTLIAIGFVHALQGNYGQAIEYLHQVNYLFFTSLLNDNHFFSLGSLVKSS